MSPFQNTNGGYCQCQGLGGIGWIGLFWCVLPTSLAFWDRAAACLSQPFFFFFFICWRVCTLQLSVSGPRQKGPLVSGGGSCWTMLPFCLCRFFLRKRLKAKNLMYIKQILYLLEKFVAVLGGRSVIPLLTPHLTVVLVLFLECQ